MASRGGGGNVLYHDGKHMVFWMVILAWLLGITTVLAVVKFFLLTGVAIIASIVGLLPVAAGNFAEYRSAAGGEKPASASAPANPGDGAVAASNGR